MKLYKQFPESLKLLIQNSDNTVIYINKYTHTHTRFIKKDMVLL